MSRRDDEVVEKHLLDWLKDRLGLEEIEDVKATLKTVLSCIDQIEKQEMTDEINNKILEYKKNGWSTKDVSDKWHTFGELYYHRMILFLTIQLAHKDKAWRSKLHDDGRMFDDSFIVGIETPEGQYSYHYDLEFWDLFGDIPELDKAPTFDGHQPSDITRLLSLYKDARHSEEQLYEVRLPLPKTDEYLYSLLDKRGTVWKGRKEVLTEDLLMTRDEIIRMDERYMLFAVPVGIIKSVRK